MDDFLDETIDILNSLPDNQIAQIKDMFTKVMHNAYYLFGERAFRKSNLINKSLFLSFSRVLYKYEPDIISRAKLNGLVRQALEDEVKNNEEYGRALSVATNDSKNVDVAYSVAKKLITRCVL